MQLQHRMLLSNSYIIQLLGLVFVVKLKLIWFYGSDISWYIFNPLINRSLPPQKVSHTEIEHSWSRARNKCISNLCSVSVCLSVLMCHFYSFYTQYCTTIDLENLNHLCTRNHMTINNLPKTILQAMHTGL